jgi:S1-C subfamily serine protease
MLTAATALGLAFFAPIPQQAFNSVVAIGQSLPDGSQAWIGSGFLYAYLCRPEANGERRYCGFVVTNRHVVAGLKDAALRLNPGSFSPQRAAEVVTLSLTDASGNPAWTVHPSESIDVAVLPYEPSPELVKKVKHMAYIVGEASFDRARMAPGTISSRNLRDSGATEGDEVYLPGFPIGVMTDQLFGANRNYPVLRRGIIAWVTPTAEGLTPEFLVDATVFPGNSGGPVMRHCGKDEADVCLIGMVKGYLPYSDVASSRQTGRARVTFEENSGLAVIIPVDEIDRTAAEHMRRTGKH